MAEDRIETAQQSVNPLTVAEWVERTRRSGVTTRESDVVSRLDELRGAWPSQVDQ